MGASRRGDFATLTHRGRQKVRSNAGDRELFSLEKMAYQKMPKVISEGKKNKKSKVKV